jgi:hypothetical protein
MGFFFFFLKKNPQYFLFVLTGCIHIYFLGLKKNNVSSFIYIFFFFFFCKEKKGKF